MTKKSKGKPQPTKVSVVLESGEDWERLIVNGTVRYENHSVPAERLIDLLDDFGIDASYKVGAFCDCGHAFKEGADVFLCDTCARIDR